MPDAKRLVACTYQDGRIETFGLFELRRVGERGPIKTVAARRVRDD